MKTLLLMACTMIFAGTVHANSISQQRADRMTTILQSKEIKELTSQKDVGNLYRVKYLSTNRARFGPENYQVTFRSYGRSGPRYCTVIAKINIQTEALMGFTSPECER